jgi:hypothetical protein
MEGRLTMKLKKLLGRKISITKYLDKAKIGTPSVKRRTTKKTTRPNMNGYPSSFFESSPQPSKNINIDLRKKKNTKVKAIKPKTAIYLPPAKPKALPKSKKVTYFLT